MTLADTNLGSMTSTVVAAPTQQTSKVEGLKETAPTEVGNPAPTPVETRKPHTYDVIARKEKAIMRERQQLAQEKAQLQAQAAQFQAWQEEKAVFEQKKLGYKTNPNNLLNDFGLTYQDLSEFQLNDGSPTPQLLIKQQQDRISALEARIADKEARQEAAQVEAQKQNEQAVIADFREQISSFVRSKPDQYELTRINEAENLVYDTVEEYYNKHQEIMPIKKAADMVEEYLANIVERNLASKKLQTRVSKPTQTKATDPQSPRTLSNSITTTSSPYSGVSPRNDADRLQRAMAKLEGR